MRSDYYRKLSDAEKLIWMIERAYRIGRQNRVAAKRNSRPTRRAGPRET